MARISIKPIEPLEMEFADGTVKEALFNNEAFIFFAEEFGDINEFIKTEAKDKPYDFLAKILYCGMKVMDRSITLGEAKSIVIMGGETLMSEITNLLLDNFILTADESAKKKFSKEMQKVNKLLQG